MLKSQILSWCYSPDLQDHYNAVSLNGEELWQCTVVIYWCNIKAQISQCRMSECDSFVALWGFFQSEGTNPAAKAATVIFFLTFCKASSPLAPLNLIGPVWFSFANCEYQPYSKNSDLCISLNLWDLKLNLVFHFRVQKSQNRKEHSATCNVLNATETFAGDIFLTAFLWQQNKALTFINIQFAT